VIKTATRGLSVRDNLDMAKQSAADAGAGKGRHEVRQENFGENCTQSVTAIAEIVRITVLQFN
jgi:hypothetical protein